ncbi:MAG: PEP-CTERM sorting domain-containing protein [Thiobacillus sp.]|nr:PEP-CTERM sorting domain-containing protein [Thiobacillus sp.]
MAVYFSPEWPTNPLVAGSVLVSSPTESFNVVTDPNAFGVQYLINAAIAPVLENGAELFSFVINRPSVGTGTVNLWAINLGSGYEIRSEDYGILAQTTVSAVPEPGAYAYMLSGIALVGAMMVRRSRKRFLAKNTNC